MKEHPKYLLVDSQILPEVYLKVILAKKLLAQGKAKSASEAAKSAGISRSAFYKYKDFIHEYNTRLSDSIMTISASLADESGVLSALMAEIFIEWREHSYHSPEYSGGFGGSCIHFSADKPDELFGRGVVGKSKKTPRRVGYQVHFRSLMAFKIWR